MPGVLACGHIEDQAYGSSLHVRPLDVRGHSAGSNSDGVWPRVNAEQTYFGTRCPTDEPRPDYGSQTHDSRGSSGAGGCWRGRPHRINYRWPRR